MTANVIAAAIRSHCVETAELGIGDCLRLKNSDIFEESDSRKASGV